MLPLLHCTAGDLLANTSGFPFSTHLQACCIRLLLYSPESMPCIFHMYTPSATPRPAMPVLQQGIKVQGCITKVRRHQCHRYTSATPWSTLPVMRRQRGHRSGLEVQGNEALDPQVRCLPRRRHKQSTYDIVTTISVFTEAQGNAPGGSQGGCIHLLKYVVRVRTLQDLQKTQTGDDGEFRKRHGACDGLEHNSVLLPHFQRRQLCACSICLQTRPLRPKLHSSLVESITAAAEP